MRYHYDRVTKITDSDNIAYISYNPQLNSMIVEFINGDGYEYLDIVPSIYGAIVSGESVGSTFQKLVRNNKSIKFNKIGH